MFEYTPNEWVLIKIGGDTPHYKVFGAWRGGYTTGDSWRMNSGVTSVKKEGNYFIFNGKSGSVYRCHKDAYGIKSPYANTILSKYESKFKNKFKLFMKLPDVIKINWIIK